MIIVKPSVEIITEPDLFKRIELAARTCYKSEGKICEGSDRNLFDKLVKSGHESALEHSNIVVEMDVPAFNELTDILRAHEYESGLPHYIRTSLDRKSLYIICSGNLRAWRTLCKEFPDEFLLCKLFGDDPAFSDIHFSRWTGDHELHFSRISGHPSDRHTIVTARFTCDRGVSHELVRHRCLSFSQSSTRYINYREGVEWVEPWWWGSADEFSGGMVEDVAEQCAICYKALIEAGHAPQAARAVLPNMLKTEVVATGTVEQWKKYVLPLRMSKAAHPDIRRLMTMFCEAMNWKEFLQ